MKWAFASSAGVNDIQKYSGTPYYMTRALEKQGIDFDYICNLKTRMPLSFKIQKNLKKLLCGQEDSSRFSIYAAKSYAHQIEQRIKNSPAEVVLTHIANPIAFLDCPQPTVLWTDALYAGMLGFINNFAQHSAKTIREANALTLAALNRCELAIFSSDWAARSAQELYGINAEKIKVVPFGANITDAPDLATVKKSIQQRSPHIINLLFIGKEWERKGGTTVFAVAHALHAAGKTVECHFVGCYPPKEVGIPAYIKCHGYINKGSEAGARKMRKLLSQAHFLFVPSRAEPFGLVFCEANAFGVPCLTSYVGGIGTIIQDGINGMTFALNAGTEIYCKFIIDLMEDFQRYETLALSAYNEYQTRLNWNVATKKVKSLISAL
jgi:glycosyltransferase involved in cell wall biosynthesis